MLGERHAHGAGLLQTPPPQRRGKGRGEAQEPDVTPSRKPALVGGNLERGAGKGAESSFPVVGVPGSPG